MVFCIGAFSSYFLTSAVLPLVLLCSVLLWFWLGGLQGQAGLAVVSVTQQISAGVNSVSPWMVSVGAKNQLQLRTPFRSYSPTLLKASRSSAISSSEKCAVDAMLYL